ncbi:MAG: GGDEF domain-containing protein, partial [Pseudomonas sp.]|nr:GGDEF domain-containing protein [Pseudomonas sp.]
MRLRILASLRSQILTFTSVLVVMSLGAVLLVVLLSSGQAIRNNIDEDMAESVQSFREAINNRRLQLVGNATVLVSDFGFKQAVASRDSATIHSMLANHGQRV